MLCLPDIRQTRDFDCGRAAVASVYQFFEIRKRHSALCTSSLDGTDPRTLEAYLRKDGFFVLSGDMTIQDLREQTKAGRPVIVLMTLHGGGHYIVVSGVARGKVCFQDPVAGSSKMDAGEFEEAWHDFDRFGQVFERFGIAVWC